MTAVAIDQMELAPTLEPLPDVAVDTDGLITEELERLRAFYDLHDHARPIPINERDYVAKCLQRHLPLIRQWKNWRFTQPLETTFVDTQDVINTMSEVTERWRKGAQLKNRSFPPLPLRYMRNEYEALYCELFGCHLPEPMLDPVLWANRVADRNWPDPNIGDHEDGAQFATGAYAKIRKGQVISKAILAAIRKRYKSHEAYVAFWEAIMEAIGIHYASAKGYRIVLSTAPSDFMQLGLIGESSCYTTGGEWEKSKTHLPTVPNSVVVMIYRDGLDKPIGRAWGILAPRAGGGEFTNFYLLPREQVLPGLRTVVQAALNIKDPLEQVVSRKFSVKDLAAKHYAYVNQDCLVLGRSPDSAEQVTAEVQSALEIFYTNADKASGAGSLRTCQSCTKNEFEPQRCESCDHGHCQGCLVEDQARLGAKQCNRCARRSGWFQCGCKRWTSRAIECEHTFEQFCQPCAEEKLSRCGRCRKHTQHQYMIYCDGCKEPRCAGCSKKDEERGKACLCRKCKQKLGIIPADPPPPVATYVSATGWSDTAANYGYYTTTSAGCTCDDCMNLASGSTTNW
jgi:hypothetical protein